MLSNLIVLKYSKIIMKIRYIHWILSSNNISKTNITYHKSQYFLLINYYYYIVLLYY